MGPLVPLVEEWGHSFFLTLTPGPRPVMPMPPPAHGPAPEQHPRGAEDQEQQEERNEAAQESEAKAVERVPVVWVGNYRLSLASLSRYFLSQAIGQARVVGVNAYAGNCPQQHQHDDDSPKYSHFPILLFEIGYPFLKSTQEYRGDL